MVEWEFFWSWWKMEMGAVENFYQMDREVTDRVWTRQIISNDHGIDGVDEDWGYLYLIVCDGCLDRQSEWFSTWRPLRRMPNTPLTLNTMQNTSHTHLHNPHTYPFHESRSREIQLSCQKSSIHREIRCQVSIRSKNHSANSTTWKGTLHSLLIHAGEGNIKEKSSYVDKIRKYSENLEHL